MLLNVLGFGNGLTLVVATCASVVMVVFAYLILKPLLRTLPGKDTGLAALRAQHRSDTAGALSIEQRLNDAVAPPTRFDDEPEPDPFTVGGG
ncbi:hypothetical protein [Rubrivirga sp. IMCC45206]|uniref:hypothetical protein n=1 Tax=Rubrivirga sp. IMCC45206 TaxID=3391614 RepID=UPI00398FF348